MAYGRGGGRGAARGGFGSHSAPHTSGRASGTAHRGTARTLRSAAPTTTPRRDTVAKEDDPPVAQSARRPHVAEQETATSHATKPERATRTTAEVPRTGGTTSRPAVATVLTASQTEVPQKLNTKIFVDGLPYQYTPEPSKPSLEQELIDFAAAWKVGKALRLIKKPGQGFGFLVFKSPHSVPLAVRFLHGRQFLGRPLRVEAPKPRDSTPTSTTSAGAGKESFQRQVLITDLSKVTQEEVIREVLRDVAPQLESRLESIKMTSRNRKAFLTFAAAEDVAPAVQFLNGFHLLGRKIAAAAAAAPGTLPYSHHGATATSTTTTAAMSTQDESTAETIAPLGLRAELPSVRPAPVQAGSNVTGRTSKYNLLDAGPAEVYVGNLTDAITESQLREHFAPCGAIRECTLLAHPETHVPSHIARITFALPAYADYAQRHYHGSQLRDCVLRVDRGDHPSPPLATESASQPDAPRAARDTSAQRMPTRERRAAKRARSNVDDTVAPDADAKLALAGMLDSDDDEDKEEHFYDVDEVPATAASVSARRTGAKGKARKEAVQRRGGKKRAAARQ